MQGLKKRLTFPLRRGMVKKILVSGDHGTWKYDEPDTMREALVRDGVTPRDVFEDHAGFDTWATMVRARNIFGVRRAVVVTQGFHMPRALYLADAAGPPPPPGTPPAGAPAH